VLEHRLTVKQCCQSHPLGPVAEKGSFLARPQQLMDYSSLTFPFLRLLPRPWVLRLSFPSALALRGHPHLLEVKRLPVPE